MGIIIKPNITEKMTNETERFNRYGFLVSTTANKVEIKQEIESRYGVNVTAVRTMIYRPDRKTKYTKSGTQFGKTNKTKKAIIEVENGQTIDLFGNLD